MAQVRNISGEPRSVPGIGLSGPRVVEDGEVIVVPDDRYLGFVEPEPGQQSTTWEPVTAPVGPVGDPTIDPAPADEDDDLGPLDLGDALADDEPAATTEQVTTTKPATKRARRGNGSN